ncbi:MAG: 2-(1,2-epoxy-1,2-dihydrophenyl)acetyl-CoA isomerase [Flavobacteriales bacterium]|jgi:2-(1,2-epoxy-1,2-dihydrophenyl)acetyl-CoA isomerase|nr:2-(1,2-epoxy-1,2-dihydrophenyl)acetyl-CoA isomerase [Flavobacteriales bacterium]NCG29040.1 2-(1,2-epoxy-1,2-dihydrophenyl)acetyl-CoA isomerase [Bacteroidota bacterium]MBT3962668.1 2-(1,2-epoxy-1,2-dihydrophenyl)acetyl-CoA isomerase [Flavobacteriales bacterium]MBT4705054.1 2-(1,2-epoxy-1,2-dihydrophenyl)acetyl-CoA isomerase [Flavobacteriales bacterium]MBT4930074.1 2-(1,2-epoxy-1,2-dihydrophenyl)acetyl-CoA isomerase [Flavobacteriales bacterium]
MSSSTLQFEIVGSVGKITLNRPEVFNSFNREMALACIEALKDCESNPAIRSIYITGSGKAFCAGQDLQDAMDEKGPEIVQIVEEHYNPIITLIRQIEKPIVAGVNGVAAGAGANIALACDIVIATKSAKFIQAFSAIGLIPDSGGTFFLPRLVGWQKASALAMLGDRVGAEDAEKMGMIYKWEEDEAFVEGSWKIADRLSKMPTKGLGLTKRLLNDSLTNNLEQQLKREGEEQKVAAKTDDYDEGVNAFLEKRKPNFKGE